MYNFPTRLKMLVYISLTLFFSAMWGLTLWRHGWSMPWPRITPQKPLILVGLAILELILLVGLYKLGLRLSVIPERRFIPVVLGLYAVLQAVFVFLFPVNAYEDSVIIDRIAKELLNKNYSSLGIGQYLGYYPNNIGITLFSAFIYSFLPNSFITLRLFNILFNTVSAWLIYKIYRELMPEKTDKSYGILLLAVTFLPTIILNNFTYGDIFSNTFCLAAMLQAVKFVHSGQKKYIINTSLFLMLGNFMRSVTFLFMVGILIYWFTNIAIRCGAGWKKWIAAVCLVILMFNLPIKIFSFAGVETGILPEPVGIHANPVWRWINIGFPGKKLGYWDGGRNIRIFISRYKCNRHAASKYFIKELVDNYKAAGIKAVVKGYTKKTFWLWTEGTYSINYYGLSQAVPIKRFLLYQTPLTKYIEPGDKSLRTALDWLLHSFNWLSLGLAAVYLVDSVKHKDFRMELFVYIVLLYIAFYMLWEVKTRYLYGVYPIFLLMVYCSVEKTGSRLRLPKSR